MKITSFLNRALAVGHQLSLQKDFTFQHKTSCTKKTGSISVQSNKNTTQKSKQNYHDETFGKLMI